jgi:hypothetical protein
MQDKKYLIFEPYRCGLSNVLMSFELAIALAHITKRSLIVPPRFWYEQIDFGKPKDLWTNVWNILDFTKINEVVEVIDLFDHDLFKSDIEKMTDHYFYFTKNISKYLDDFYEFTNENEPEENRILELISNKSCFVNGLIDDEEFRVFSKDRTVINVNRPEKYIIFSGNLFGYFWHQVYAGNQSDRNDMKIKVNDCMSYVKRYFEIADVIFKKSGFNAVHIRSGEPRSIHSYTATSFGDVLPLDNSEIITNSVKHFFEKDKILYVANDLKNKSLLDKLKEEYNCVFLEDLAPGLSELEKAIIDQIICSRADFFVGTYASTYTKRINIMRGLNGKQTSDFTGLNYINPNVQESFGAFAPWIKTGWNHWPWHWSCYPQWTLE